MKRNRNKVLTTIARIGLGFGLAGGLVSALSGCAVNTPKPQLGWKDMQVESITQDVESNGDIEYLRDRKLFTYSDPERKPRTFFISEKRKVEGKNVWDVDVLPNYWNREVKNVLRERFPKLSEYVDKKGFDGVKVEEKFDRDSFELKFYFGGEKESYKIERVQEAFPISGPFVY